MYLRFEIFTQDSPLSFEFNVYSMITKYMVQYIYNILL